MKKSHEYFYVYFHMYPWHHPIFPNQVFYVGKGYGERAWHKAKRNRRHQFIINKYGMDNIVVVIIRCESEDAAYSLEIELIEVFHRQGHGLVNVTLGGKGGMRGYKHPENTRVKMKVSAKTRKSQPEEALVRQREIMQTPYMRELSRKRFQGVSPTQEVKDKISAKLVGHAVSQHTRDKVSVALNNIPAYLRSCTWCGRSFCAYHAERGFHCSDTCYSRQSSYSQYTEKNKWGKLLRALPPLEDKHNPRIVRELGRVIIDQRHNLAA